MNGTFVITLVIVAVYAARSEAQRIPPPPQPQKQTSETQSQRLARLPPTTTKKGRRPLRNQNYTPGERQFGSVSRVSFDRKSGFPGWSGLNAPKTSHPAVLTRPDPLTPKVSHPEVLTIPEPQRLKQKKVSKTTQPTQTVIQGRISQSVGQQTNINSSRGKANKASLTQALRAAPSVAYESSQGQTSGSKSNNGQQYVVLTGQTKTMIIDKQGRTRDSNGTKGFQGSMFSKNADSQQHAHHNEMSFHGPSQDSTSVNNTLKSHGQNNGPFSKGTASKTASSQDGRLGIQSQNALSDLGGHPQSQAGFQTRSKGEEGQVDSQRQSSGSDSNQQQKPNYSTFGTSLVGSSTFRSKGKTKTKSMNNRSIADMHSRTSTQTRSRKTNRRTGIPVSQIAGATWPRSSRFSGSQMATNSVPENAQSNDGSLSVESQMYIVKHPSGQGVSSRQQQRPNATSRSSSSSAVRAYAFNKSARQALPAKLLSSEHEFASVSGIEIGLESGPSAASTSSSDRGSNSNFQQTISQSSGLEPKSRFGIISSQSSETQNQKGGSNQSSQILGQRPITARGQVSAKTSKSGFGQIKLQSRKAITRSRFSKFSSQGTEVTGLGKESDKSSGQETLNPKTRIKSNFSSLSSQLTRSEVVGETKKQGSRQDMQGSHSGFTSDGSGVDTHGTVSRSGRDQSLHSVTRLSKQDKLNGSRETSILTQPTGSSPSTNTANQSKKLIIETTFPLGHSTPQKTADIGVKISTNTLQTGSKPKLTSSVKPASTVLGMQSNSPTSESQSTASESNHERVNGQVAPGRLSSSFSDTSIPPTRTKSITFDSRPSSSIRPGTMNYSNLKDGYGGPRTARLVGKKVSGSSSSSDNTQSASDGSLFASGSNVHAPKNVNEAASRRYTQTGKEMQIKQNNGAYSMSNTQNTQGVYNVESSQGQSQRALSSNDRKSNQGTHDSLSELIGKPSQNQQAGQRVYSKQTNQNSGQSIPSKQGGKPRQSNSSYSSQYIQDGQSSLNTRGGKAPMADATSKYSHGGKNSQFGMPSNNSQTQTTSQSTQSGQASQDSATSQIIKGRHVSQAGVSSKQSSKSSNSGTGAQSNLPPTKTKSGPSPFRRHGKETRGGSRHTAKTAIVKETLEREGTLGGNQSSAGGSFSGKRRKSSRIYHHAVLYRPDPSPTSQKSGTGQVGRPGLSADNGRNIGGKNGGNVGSQSGLQGNRNSGSNGGQNNGQFSEQNAGQIGGRFAAGYQSCSSTPVCGSDGFTYMSDCYLGPGLKKMCAGFCPCPANAPPPPPRPAVRPQIPLAQAAYEPPPPCNCPFVYEPVCGINARTYDNDCERRCAYSGLKCAEACPCDSRIKPRPSKRTIAKYNLTADGKRRDQVLNTTTPIPITTPLEIVPTTQPVVPSTDMFIPTTAMLMATTPPTRLKTVAPAPNIVPTTTKPKIRKRVKSKSKPGRIPRKPKPKKKRITTTTTTTTPKPEPIEKEPIEREAGQAPEVTTQQYPVYDYYNSASVGVGHGSTGTGHDAAGTRHGGAGTGYFGVGTGHNSFGVQTPGYYDYYSSGPFYNRPINTYPQTNNHNVYPPFKGPGTCSCPNYISPVCGTDGITYENPCTLNCAGEQWDCDGNCPCSAVQRQIAYDPQPSFNPQPVYEPQPSFDPQSNYDPQPSVDANTYPDVNNEPSNQPLSTCECVPGDIDPVCTTDGVTEWYGCEAICLGATIACSSECPC